MLNRSWGGEGRSVGGPVKTSIGTPRNDDATSILPYDTSYCLLDAQIPAISIVSATMVSARRAIMVALLPVGATFFVSPPHASRKALMAPAETRSPQVQRFNVMRLAGVPSSEESSSVRGTSVSTARTSPDVFNEASTVVLERDDSFFEQNDSFGGPWRPLLTVPPLVLTAATACSQASVAAVTGGRIGGGGYTAPPAERTPSAPPMQQQQRYKPPPQRRQYSPRAGRDIYGSEGSRFHVSFDNARGGRRSNRARFNHNAGEITSSTITPGDVAMVGGVSATIAAVQRYNRKRFLEDEAEGYGRAPSSPPQARAARKGREPAAVVTTLQLSLFCDRKGGQGDVLATLDKLSQTADVNSGRGLSTLVNEVSGRSRPEKALTSQDAHTYGWFCADASLLMGRFPSGFYGQISHCCFRARSSCRFETCSCPRLDMTMFTRR